MKKTLHCRFCFVKKGQQHEHTCRYIREPSAHLHLPAFIDIGDGGVAAHHSDTSSCNASDTPC